MAFSDEFTSLVDDAEREFHRHQEEMARRDAERRRQAGKLEAHLLRRFRELEEVLARNPGKLLLRREPTRDGIVWHEIHWRVPPPIRDLLISVHEGRLSWGWRLGPHGPFTPQNADVMTTSPEDLDNLIRAVADQATWGRGRAPDVRLPRPEVDDE